MDILKEVNALHTDVKLSKLSDGSVLYLNSLSINRYSLDDYICLLNSGTTSGINKIIISDVIIKNEYLNKFIDEQSPYKKYSDGSGYYLSATPQNYPHYRIEMFTLTTICGETYAVKILLGNVQLELSDYQPTNEGDGYSSLSNIELIVFHGEIRYEILK